MRNLALLFVLVFPAPLAAQVLVKNISGPTGEKSSTPGSAVTIGSVTYFSATNTALGRELWKTDGTTAGTVLVKDIGPGPVSGSPNYLTDVNGTLFFSVDQGAQTSLWKSDGTEAGTVEVIPSGTAETISALRAAGNTLFFFARTPTTGWEVWRSDGTASGTFMVMDIAPGPASSVLGASTPSPAGVVGGRLYFAATEPTAGEEMWVSDGTLAGTVLVADLEPGVGSSEPSDFTDLGGEVVFTAKTFALGREIYKSNGTQAGTQLVVELRPGRPWGTIGQLAAWRGAVYFNGTGSSGVQELWRTDGTAAGTQLVAPDSGTSPRSLVPAGSLLFYNAIDPTLGRRLWRTDGTPAGTVLLGNTRIDQGSAALGSSLMFVGPDLTRGSGISSALWRSDGTPAGTTILRTFTFARNPVQLGNGVIFSANDGVLGEEPWKSDGTPTGTTLLSNIHPPQEMSSHPIELTRSGDLVFFGPSSGGISYANALWASDGTEAGTRFVGPGGWGLTEFTDVAGTLFYSENTWSLYIPSVLWKSDGTPLGTVGVQSFLVSPSPPYGLGHLTALGNTLMFSAQLAVSFGGLGVPDMYRSDGTQAGTLQVTTGFRVADLTVAGQRCYFTASYGGSGRELWATNAAGGGVYLVADIHPNGSSNPGSLTAVGDVLFFSATDRSNGTELWTTDGTEAGTRLVKDIRPGRRGSAPSWLTATQGELFFSADDGTSGRELWKTDGTAPGTVLVADLRPGPDGGLPAALTAAGDRLFFSADHADAGREPFASDGTAGGTVLLRDINPNGNSNPKSFTAVGTGPYVLFAATEPITGTEAWSSDGTPAGTALVSDLEPGPGSSNPAGFTQLGSRVLHAATESSVGRELFAIDLAALGIPLVERYGTGCPGTGALVPTLDARGLPLIGSAAFAVTVENARPLSPGALFVSATRTQVLLGECSLLVVPQVALPVATDATGRLLAPLPVPNDPSLVGLELDLQALIADPAGELLGAASSTQGLALLIGR